MHLQSEKLCKPVAYFQTPHVESSTMNNALILAIIPQLRTHAAEDDVGAAVGAKISERGRFNYWRDKRCPCWSSEASERVMEECRDNLH
jgi:hypothetical protein